LYSSLFEGGSEAIKVNGLPRSVFKIASAEYKRNARIITLTQKLSSISTTIYHDSTFEQRLAHFNLRL